MTTLLGEGYIMSETQYDRLENLIISIKDDLATVKTDVEVIKTSVKDYPNIVSNVTKHETEIQLLKKDCEHIKGNCTQIQDFKKQNKSQPGAVKTGIIVGVIVATVSGIIGIVVNMLT
jgi:prophage DNA circulation protein